MGGPPCSPVTLEAGSQCRCEGQSILQEVKLEAAGPTPRASEVRLAPGGRALVSPTSWIPGRHESILLGIWEENFPPKIQSHFQDFRTRVHAVLRGVIPRTHPHKYGKVASCRSY